MPDLHHLLILVTGATSGIGRSTAKALALRGAHVVLLARNAAKAEATRAFISAAAGPGSRVDVLLCDLADVDQVRRAAAEFNARYPRLDVLINNAGMLPAAQRELTPAGLEVCLATNHLGPFLLTSLLLTKLRQSPASRIVNVASAGYQLARPDLADLQQERGYGVGRVYGNTKLYNIMFTQELARRLRHHGIHHVVTNALHPGVVATNLSGGTRASGWMVVLSRLLRPFVKKARRGADTTLFLATDPAAAQSSGNYFIRQNPEAVQHSFNTPANARQLWQRSEELTGCYFLPE